MLFYITELFFTSSAKTTLLYTLKDFNDLFLRRAAAIDIWKIVHRKNRAVCLEEVRLIE